MTQCSASFCLSFLLVFAASVQTLQSAPAARRMAGESVVLENEFLIATINPKGAALSSLVLLPGKAELLAGPSMADGCLLPLERYIGLSNTVFQAADAGAAAVCELKAFLPPEPPLTEEQKKSFSGGGAWNGFLHNPGAVFNKNPLETVRLTKRYRLPDGASELQVEYELENTGKEPVQVCLAIDTAFKADPKGSRYSVPTREGALVLALPLRADDENKLLWLHGRKTTWYYDLPGAWTATVAPGGPGAAAWLDPRFGSFVRMDAASGATRIGWTRLSLPPGGTVKARASIMAVNNLARVHDVRDGLAACFEVKPDSADGLAPALITKVTDVLNAEIKKKTKTLSDPTAGSDDAGATDILADPAGAGESLKEAYRGPALDTHVTLVSSRARSLTAVVKTRRNPLGEWREAGSSKVDLPAGGTAVVPIPLKPAEEGTYIARVELMEDGKSAAVFEHPIVAGSPSGFFRPEIPAREGQVNDEYLYRDVKRAGYPIRGDWQPSMEVETSHVKYAVPLSGGPLKVLAISPYWGSREIVELRQRLGMQVDAVCIGKCGYRNKYELYYHVTEKYALFDDIDRARKLLSEPHDVILLVNLYGDWFPYDIMREIARQVREEGAGCVMLYPDSVIGPMDELAKGAKNEPGTASRRAAIGKGRVAVYDGIQAFSTYTYVKSEPEYEDIVRSILWASRRAPAVSLAIAGPGNAADRREFAARPLAAQVRNELSAPFRGKFVVQPQSDLIGAYSFYAVTLMGRRYYDSYENITAPFEQEVSLAAGEEKRIELRLPALPAGKIILDARVLDDKGGVVAWKRLPLDLASKVSFAETIFKRPNGETARFNAPGEKPTLAAKPDETLEIVCNLKGAGGEKVEKVRLTASEPYGRLVADQTAPVAWNGENGAARFQTPLNASLHRILIFRFQALDGAEVVNELRAQIFVHSRPELVPPYELRAYANVEINPDAAYDTRVGGGDPLALAWFNIRKSEYGGWVPSCTKIIAPGDDTNKAAAQVTLNAEAAPLELERDRKPDLRAGWIRVPCLNDPAWRAAAFKEVEGNYRNYSVYGPFRGFAVDEWFYYKEKIDGKSDECRRTFLPGRDTNICRCQHCLKLFSAFANKLFGGDLATLNNTWHTAYKSWEEVDPPALDPAVSNAPPETVWPHILAHRRFIDGQLADVIAETRRRIEAIDPGCETGMSGVWGTRIWTGMDIALLAPNSKFNMLYSDVDIWVSFGAGGGVRWTGYSNKYNPAHENKIAWSELFDGMAAVGYYGKQIDPMERADYTFHEASQAMFDGMRAIRAGGYDRLLSGYRQVDPAVICYDTRSIYTSDLEEWAEDAAKYIADMRNAGRAHAPVSREVAYSYRALLRGRNLQPAWIAGTQLETNVVGRYGTPKVIFLPYQTVLSDSQAKTLERFVGEGGVIVGDVQTGLRDGHGNRRARGALDHVFGIERKGEWRMRVRKNADGKQVPVRFGAEFGEPFELAFAGYDPMEIAPLTAKPMASCTLDGKEHPAFLVNSFGKGKAIYLNFLPAGYQAIIPAGVNGEESVVKDMQGKAAELFARMFDKLMDIAGLKPPLECEGATVSRFADGSLSYIGLRSTHSNLYSEAHSALVRLPVKAHVYDSVRGKYLGNTAECEAHFDPLKHETTSLLAILPYKVEGVDLKLAASQVAPGAPVLFTARILPEAAQKERHVFGVKVVDPNGKTPRVYRHSVETRGGVASGRVDLALNDPKGKWKLVLTDAATGASAEKEFSVE